MRTITAEQRAFIERCRVAVTRAIGLAEEANRLELPVLAREWDYIAKCLTDRVAIQLRAFAFDESLPDESRTEEGSPPC